MKTLACRMSIRLSLLLFASTLTLLSTQNVLAADPGPMGFAYTYNVFALDDTTSLVELDYQYSERGLKYERSEGRTLGRLMVMLEIWDSTGREIVASSWITTNPKPDDGDEDHILLGVKLFGVRPGKHKAKIAYADVANPKNSDSTSFDLTVRKFRSGPIALSDVQVITEITPSTDTKNRFYKNGYIIYPNVLSSIDPPFLLLNTYLEVYNANSSPLSQFEVVYGIADSNFRLFYEKSETRERPSTADIIEVHSVVVDELPSGSYYLIVKAFAGLRGTATDSAHVIRMFTISNPDKDAAIAQAPVAMPVSNTGVDMIIDPNYAGMTESELNAEFAKFKYLAVEGDKVWEKLSGAPAKARYMTEFWARRDPDPNTPKNEMRDEVYSRIESANTMYREPHVDQGYLTHRGRVLLQYGRPDNIDRHYMDPNRKPYEIWKYDDGNMLSVFVDRMGIGKFVLVHSTEKGEPQAEDWIARHATVVRSFEP